MNNNTNYITKEEFKKFKEDISQTIEKISENNEKNIKELINKIKISIDNNKKTNQKKPNKKKIYKTKKNTSIDKYKEKTLDTIKKKAKTEDELSESLNESENDIDYEDLKQKIKYIENNDNTNNTYKYYLNKFYIPTLTANYNCLDSKCKGRLRIEYVFIDGDFKDITISQKINIAEHDIKYTNHNYIRDTLIKSYIEQYGTKTIINKCKGFNYLINFIKEYGIINFNYNLKGTELKQKLLNNYNDLKINYNNISEQDIKKYKILYKKNNKIEEDINNIQIEKALI